VSEFLQQLADKVAEGKLILSQGNEEITLQFAQSLTLEVEVEVEDKGARGVQHSLEAEIKWFDGEQGSALELK